MEAVFDFFRAALPWIGMGLLLAMYCADSVKNKEDQSENYGAEGMCLGMCLGTAIGTALGNNIAIGLPLGMLLGMVIGSSIKKEEKSDEQTE